jgi:hypothetical protein
MLKTFAVIIIAGVVLLGRPQSAAACEWYNPLCWVEDTWSWAWGEAKGALDLAWDVITLKPEDAWDDFIDVAYHEVCGQVRLISYVAGYGLEAGFDRCDGPAEPIEPDILAKLSLYFRSSLDTVRVHKGCKIGGRDGITFGEHIYFKEANFDPHDKPDDPHHGDSDFALLAHELTHVLQYRKKGFSEFVCEYGLKCKLGLDKGCAFEGDAYRYQNMVLEDRMRDRDGIFTCPLGPYDNVSPDCNKNAKFIACHSTTPGPKPAYCKHYDNCPNNFNPGQEDFDKNIIGNACDVGWTSDPSRSTEFQSFGDFDGDGKTDILVQKVVDPMDPRLQKDKIGILSFDSNTSSLIPLMVASHGASFGDWHYNSATDHVVAIADFNGDGKDDILIIGQDGIGILTFDSSSKKLISLMVKPDETWFVNSLVGWRFQVDTDRIVGTADLNGDGRQDIVITSPWGIGILTFDKASKSLTPLMLKPNGTQFVMKAPNGKQLDSWVLDSLRNSIAGFGTFNFLHTPSIVIRSDNKLGILTLDGDTLRLVAVVSDGNKVGTWKFNAKTDRIAGIGSFHGPTDQILIMGDSGLGILGANYTNSFELVTYVHASNGAELGNWVLDTRVNSIAGVGKFEGFDDNIIIRSPWGIGILKYKDSWLTTLTLAPSGTRFGLRSDLSLGGWLYNSASDKILGKGRFQILQDGIVIGSQWGIGLLSVSGFGSGATIRSMMLAPNGTLFKSPFGTWPLDLTVGRLGVFDFEAIDRLGLDTDVGRQTMPTWVAGRAQ